MDNLLIKYNTDDNYLNVLLHSNETDANDSMKNDLNLIQTHNLKTELDISVNFFYFFFHFNYCILFLPIYIGEN